MSEQESSTILFLIDKDNSSVFFSILQQGFNIVVEVGCSLKSLICDQFGATPEYLSARISTIFLNGKPVDDVESAIVKDGDTLALSGAMPGLVGAAFRSGGALSVFRGSITHENDKKSIDLSANGMITLKLFNLLVSEMGPAFLEKGFWIPYRSLCDFIDSKKSALSAVLKSVSINGQKIDGQKIELDALNSLKKYDDNSLIHIVVQI